MISEKWDAALRAKQEEDQMARNNALNQEVGQYDNLVNAANQQRGIVAHQRDVAFLSLFKNAASRGNGTTDPALNQACGTALGIPNFCGMRMIDKGFAKQIGDPSLAGSFALYHTVQDKKSGGVRPLPVAIVGTEQMRDITNRLRRNGYDSSDVRAVENMTWAVEKDKTGLTDQQLSERGFQNPNGPILVGGTTSTQNIQNSQNVNLTTGKRSDSGARPGPRARFVSEDDLNGTPYKDENAPGRRYLGHGISSFSTADWQEDREEKRRREDRLYEATMANAKGKGLSAEDRLKIAEMNEKGRNERNAANNETRLNLVEKRNEERKALREQNKILRQMQQIANARDKEVDPKKKAEYQAQYDALQKRLVDVPDADESVNQNGGGSGTPAPTGAAAAIAQGRKGRSEVADTPVKGAKPQVQDEAAPKSQTPAPAAAQTEGKDGNKKEDHGGKKEEVKTITIPDSIKDDFKRNYPEATEKDIASGKYDVQIKNMAKRKGDAASSGEAEQRMKKRAVEQSQKAAKNFESDARQIDAEYESELDEARKEIEREADSSGRDQKWIEAEYASQKRKIDALYKNKRMKYNQQYGAY